MHLHDKRLADKETHRAPGFFLICVTSFEPNRQDKFPVSENSLGRKSVSDSDPEGEMIIRELPLYLN